MSCFQWRCAVSPHCILYGKPRIVIWHRPAIGTGLVDAFGLDLAVERFHDRSSSRAVVCPAAGIPQPPDPARSGPALRPALRERPSGRPPGAAAVRRGFPFGRRRSGGDGGEIPEAACPSA